MNTYTKIAKDILKDKIKSAVFIDENAREFTSSDSDLNGKMEEKLSLDLYDKFRESGVFLEPIKYELGKDKDKNWMDYCLSNRDLILLDWQLTDLDGEIHSMRILNEIIKTPNIHFCVIYTNENNLDNVFKQILTNYSNINKEDYDSYKEHTEISFGEEFNYEEFHKISTERNNDETRRFIGSLLGKNRESINSFKEEFKITDNLCAIYKISSINLDVFHKELDHPLPCPEYLDISKYLLKINSTIITIFKKDENKPETLLGNFYTHIIDSPNSFNYLLTIDFFNRIRKVGVIDKDNSIDFSKDALLEHRQKLKDEGFEELFDDFVKELLFEKINLSLRDSSSPLLSEDIFNELYDKEKKPSDQDRQKMNVFYNSMILDKTDKTINFGDVFKFKDEEKYLICLTPLCDCLRPQEKTKRNYFFAEGVHIALGDALKLGDTAFVSYLPNGKVVRWTEAPSEASKYTPVYIKPLQYKVLKGEDTINNEKEISLYYLNKEGERKNKVVQYITTIRQNYAQRISNHAFSYPMRVGVDFVKI